MNRQFQKLVDHNTSRKFAAIDTKKKSIQYDVKYSKQFYFHSI